MSRRADVIAEAAAELRAADERAPRLYCASTYAIRHPEWNEDRTLCDPLLGVAAVFDGMGGAAGGELASSSAAGALTQMIDELPDSDDERIEWLERAMRACESAVELSRKAYDHAPTQATTATLAVRLSDGIALSSVGDSRAYRLSETGALEQISKDDHGLSRLREMADSDEEFAAALEAMNHVQRRAELGAHRLLPLLLSQRHVIGQALGELTGPIERPQRIKLNPGDRVILTSDGIHDNLATPEITAVARRAHGAGDQALADALVMAADERRQQSAHLRCKDDDLSAVVLPFD